VPSGGVPQIPRWTDAFRRRDEHAGQSEATRAVRG